jgi:succinoglycan biosynthesis transport protein ExoP
MSAFVSNPALKSILRGVVVWAPLWILSTVVFGSIGVVYAYFLKSDIYLSSQALLVRDEANGAVMRLGRFQSQAEMKAAQETILEMAKSHQVVQDALAAVGQSPTLLSWMDFRWTETEGGFPSKELIEQTAKNAIQVHAPKGTEFGVTEVIYLDVKATSPKEAVQLNNALCDSLEARLQQVRKARANGVIEELSHARESAQKALMKCTKELNEIERRAGSDLTDLRGMTDNLSGANTSRVEYDQIKNEIRQVEASKQTLLSDKDLLSRASEDPNGLKLAPSAILNAHPGLKRISEGLVDLQISRANILGKFTPFHPSAVASRSAQESITNRFHQELKSSLASVDADIALADQKLLRLEAQKRIAEERLSKLAGGRASYANLAAEVKSRSAMLDACEKSLAEAQAARDASVSTSLLTRLDAPIVSDRPIGPGRTTLAGMCAIAGLLIGLGFVFVITPIDFGPAYGRRAVDRATGRRTADSLMEMALGTRVPERKETKATDESIISARNELPSAPDSSTLHATGPDKSTLEKAIPSPVENLKGNSDSENEDWPTRKNVNGTETLQACIAPRRAKINLKVEMEEVDALAAATEKVLPAKSLPLPDSKSTGNEEIDQAFREIARLKNAKPENRSEEISVQMKINELRSVLSSLGHRADTETLNREGWTRPRPSSHS